MSAALSPNALAQIERAALALLDAVRSARSGPSPVAGGISLCDACNEFLVSKARSNRSDRYLKTCVSHLKAFSQGKLNRPLGEITSAEIEQWLYDNDWEAHTRRGHLLTVRTMFNFAVSRLHIAGNPAMGVDLPTPDDCEPRIHDPNQVRHVLQTALGIDPALCRWMAIRYFAGLRASEAETLTDGEIDGEHIEVKAAKSKTRQRRLVTIQPNLREWLKLGSLPVRQLNDKHWRLVRAVGFECPQNVTRHSFVSYHLAQFCDASRTALEAGHSQEMVFRNYRKVVTPAASQEFWGIVPG